MGHEWRPNHVFGYVMDSWCVMSFGRQLVGQGHKNAPSGRNNATRYPPAPAWTSPTQLYVSCFANDAPILVTERHRSHVRGKRSCSLDGTDRTPERRTVPLFNFLRRPKMRVFATRVTSFSNCAFQCTLSTCSALAHSSGIGVRFHIPCVPSDVGRARCCNLPF